MTCTRCEGLMVQDDLLDLDDLGGGPWIRAWRCVNCGALVEDTIHANRLTANAKDSKSRSKAARKQTASCPR